MQQQHSHIKLSACWLQHAVVSECKKVPAATLLLPGLTEDGGSRRGSGDQKPLDMRNGWRISVNKQRTRKKQNFKPYFSFPCWNAVRLPTTMTSLILSKQYCMAEG